MSTPISVGVSTSQSVPSTATGAQIGAVQFGATTYGVTGWQIAAIAGGALLVLWFIFKRK